MGLAKEQLEAMRKQDERDDAQRAELIARNSKYKTNEPKSAPKPALYSRNVTAKPVVKPKPAASTPAKQVDTKQIRANLAARNKAMADI